MPQHLPSPAHAGALRALRRAATPALALALACSAAGCISTDSDVLDATEGCDELQTGNASELKIDAKAKDFILASQDVSASIDKVSGDVLTACAGMAADLGADDTWSNEKTLKLKISNDADTGACDVALKKIDENMNRAAQANVDLRVGLVKGECHLEFDAQTACDSECAGNTTCEPGEFTSRCEPGSISSICNGDCMAGAFCVGSAKLAANCKGHCEATCEGACAGKCYHDNGEVTENDANCHGVCTAQCEGTCSGRCEVEAEAGIACGAGVFCHGTCDGAMDSPSCTTEFKEPECKVDMDCYDACTARLATQATCTPTEVNVIADVKVMPDLEPVVATLNKNLPALVAAAEAEGKLVQGAGKRMADAGSDLNGRVDDLDGKSLACVGVASSALADAVDTINISVKACLKIQTKVNVSAEEQSSDDSETTAAAGSGGDGA
jgi:hypothetical protein